MAGDFARLGRAGAGLVVALLLAVWLFAPTYRRHFPPTLDGRTLRFAHFGSSEDYELWREVIADFERLHPGVTVRQEYVVGFSGRYNTKLRQQIATGTCPDVVLIQLAPFHELAEHFADLTDLRAAGVEADETLEAVCAATAWRCFESNERQRALPVSGGTLQIYANRTCFERAAQFRGQPVPLPADDWTMEDFRRTAELLTCDFDGDGQLDQFGCWRPRWVYYLPFLWSFGAEVLDEQTGLWRLTGPAAEQAVEYYYDLTTTRRVCPRAEEIPQLWQDTGFLTGKVALCINGPWFMPFLDETRLAESYSVLPIPNGPGGRVTRVTWDGLVLAPDLPPAQHDSAWQFACFVLSPAVQERIAARGRALPARKSAAAHFTRGGHQPQRRRFVEALDYARTQPCTPHFTQLDRLLNRRLGTLLASDPTADISAFLAELRQAPIIVNHFSNTGDLIP